MRIEEKILKAMNDIEEDFIAEASAFLTETDARGAQEADESGRQTIGKQDQREPRRKSRLWRYGGVLAACLIVTVVTTVSLMPAEKEPAGDPLTAQEQEKLPLLTLEEKRGNVQPEKRTKKLPAKTDQDQREAGSPWAETETVEKLPVYSNKTYAAAADADSGQTTVDREALADQVVMTAAAVDLDVDPSEVTVEESNGADDQPADQPACEPGYFAARAETDQGTVEVSLDNKTMIRFTESVPLPEAYRVPEDQRSAENMEAAAGWLLSEYQSLTGFAGSRASVEVFWQEDGQKWILSGCEKEDDTASQIVSYNLKRVFFQLDDEGNLSGILLKDYMSCSEKIEEYPIITEADAQALLEAGEYTTRCGAAMPGTSNIRRVSLVYLAGRQYNIFMPYYAFDIQLPEGAGGSGEAGGTDFDEDLVDCGTYYVPAVKGDYIVNMPKNKTE